MITTELKEIYAAHSQIIDSINRALSSATLAQDDNIVIERAQVPGIVCKYYESLGFVVLIKDDMCTIEF